MKNIKNYVRRTRKNSEYFIQASKSRPKNKGETPMADIFLNLPQGARRLLIKLSEIDYFVVSTKCTVIKIGNEKPWTNTNLYYNCGYPTDD